MNLILLRHFQRFSKPLFFTELTTVGKKNAKSIVSRLSTLNIKHIFSSPFLRTIQSVVPFCEYSGIKINAENGLYESLDDCVFKNEPIYDIRNIESPVYTQHINTDYKSVVYKNHITYPDSLNNVNERVTKFYKWIIKNYKQNYKQNKDGNILCVSHQTTLYYLSKLCNCPTKLREGEILIITI